MEKRNLLLTIAYDGRAYHGWQIQENALSVQEVFQGALRQVIGDDFDVKGSEPYRFRRSREPILHQPENWASNPL